MTHYFSCTGCLWTTETTKPVPAECPRCRRTDTVFELSPAEFEVYVPEVGINRCPSCNLRHGSR